MARMILIGLAVTAVACGRGNQPSAGSDASGAPSATAAQSTQTITVAGCLRPADQVGSAVGTSGSTATGTPATGNGVAANNNDRFMLANAAIAAPAPAPGSATPNAAPSYLLDGATSELSQHVNQQVQITGRVDAIARTAPASARDNPSSVAASGAAPLGSTADRLQVDSVQMIAATCSLP